MSGGDHNQADPWLGHVHTDPACQWHRPPTSRVARWWFDRQRGLSCRACAAARGVVSS